MKFALWPTRETGNEVDRPRALRVVCVFFTLLFSLFSWRSIYLQIVRHDYYTEIAADKHVGRNVIPAERGAIYDAGDEILAQNVPVANVVADATLITMQRLFIPLLAERLQTSASRHRGEDRHRPALHRFETRSAEAEVSALEGALSAAKLRGIRCERGTIRVYPNGSMLCHVVGFTDIEQKGIQDGVEKSMDQYLRGRKWLSLHRARRPGPRNRPLPRPGA